MSFNAIPFFPEKSYGYSDCERDVADGIKKKLNGSLVRGVKVRVEDDRPDTFVPGGVPSEEVEGEEENRKRAKKSNNMGYDQSRAPWDSYYSSTACGVLYIHNFFLTEKTCLPIVQLSITHSSHPFISPNELLQTAFQRIPPSSL